MMSYLKQPTRGKDIQPNRDFLTINYRPQTKLREGNALNNLSVNLFTRWWGMMSLPVWSHVPSRDMVPGGEGRGYSPEWDITVYPPRVLTSRERYTSY